MSSLIIAVTATNINQPFQLPNLEEVLTKKITNTKCRHISIIHNEMSKHNHVNNIQFEHLPECTEICDMILSNPDKNYTYTTVFTNLFLEFIEINTYCWNKACINQHNKKISLTLNKLITVNTILDRDSLRHISRADVVNKYILDNIDNPLTISRHEKSMVIDNLIEYQFAHPIDLSETNKKLIDNIIQKINITSSSSNLTILSRSRSEYVIEQLYNLIKNNIINISDDTLKSIALNACRSIISTKPLLEFINNIRPNILKEYIIEDQITKFNSIDDIKYFYNLLKQIPNQYHISSIIRSEIYLSYDEYLSKNEHINASRSVLNKDINLFHQKIQQLCMLGYKLTPNDIFICAKKKIEISEISENKNNIFLTKDILLECQNNYFFPDYDFSEFIDKKLYNLQKLCSNSKTTPEAVHDYITINNITPDIICLKICLKCNIPVLKYLLDSPKISVTRDMMYKLLKYQLTNTNYQLLTTFESI